MRICDIGWYKQVPYTMYTFTVPGSILVGGEGEKQENALR